MHRRAARVSIGAAPSTCSKLSSTRSARRPRRKATSASSGPRPRPLDQSKRAGDRGRDEVGVADRSELDEHHATGELGVEACCGLDREPRLARSGRSRERQEAHICPAQQRADLPLLPARGRRTRSIALAASEPAAALRSHRSDVQLRILIEDRPLEAAQRRSRLDPELLDQRGPRRSGRPSRASACLPER